MLTTSLAPTSRTSMRYFSYKRKKKHAQEVIFIFKVHFLLVQYAVIPYKFDVERFFFLINVLPHEVYIKKNYKLAFSNNERDRYKHILSYAKSPKNCFDSK